MCTHRKSDEKTTFYHHLLCVKPQICIGNTKIEKLKIWPHSKIIIDQGHVLGNTNFCPGRQICGFTHMQCFFLRFKKAIVFCKGTGKTPTKNDTYGIYEERCYSCDLRKELWAQGGVGSLILRKTDHFLHYTRKYQNLFVKLILGFFSTFQVSKCAI